MLLRVVIRNFNKHDMSWLNYIKVDIISLMGCNAIYMLDNWTNSKGAKIERKLAIDLGYKVIYEAKTNIYANMELYFR